MDNLNDIKPASDTTLKLYVFCWAVLLIILVASVWDRDTGIMTDAFSGRRWAAWLAACIFGFGLGWLLFPRRIPAFWDTAEEDDTH